MSRFNGLYCDLGTGDQVAPVNALQPRRFDPPAFAPAATDDDCGGRMSFGRTIQSWVNRWVEQKLAESLPAKIGASGVAILAMPMIIPAIIQSWEIAPW